MKYKIIKSDRFLKLMSVFIEVSAITLYPFIVVPKDFSNVITLNHERIHLEQQKELLIVFFYILYILYWLKNRVQGMNNLEAYMNIPFEQEAYEHQNNFNYLKERKKYAWKTIKN